VLGFETHNKKEKYRVSNVIGKTLLGERFGKTGFQEDYISRKCLSRDFFLELDFRIIPLGKKAFRNITF
jgi:hypothetical protein